MTTKTDRFQAIGTNRFTVHEERTNVDPVLFISDELLETIDDRSVKQLADAAAMPGVVSVSGMPDIHEGYGVPIGCVMAMDAEEGLVSAGAVGMDINCGVRLLTSDVPADALGHDELKDLTRAVEKRIPTGIGTTSPHLEELQPYIEDILEEGVSVLVNKGYAVERDLTHIQDEGCFPGADPSTLTSDARGRMDQLSTLGGGNHFLELVEVDEVSDGDTAGAFKLENGQLGVVIHTGSRGLGHQLCVDYSNKMVDAKNQFDLSFPTKNLAAAPIESDLGRDYLGAMACAANFAYANRQMITYDVRDAFDQFFHDRSGSPCLDVVYDITHNLARFETIEEREVLVHRKGAVRSLPPDHPDTPGEFSETGHPVLVPGNMAMGSYVLTAGNNAHESQFSINHGAGRRMSRTQAKEEISEEMLLDQLGDVILMGASRKKVRDEAPAAYKNVADVVDILTEIDIANRVCHLKPLSVIKGD